MKHIVPDTKLSFSGTKLRAVTEHDVPFKAQCDKTWQISPIVLFFTLRNLFFVQVVRSRMKWQNFWLLFDAFPHFFSSNLSTVFPRPDKTAAYCMLVRSCNRHRIDAKGAHNLRDL